MPLKALQDSTLADSREWQSFANTALSTLCAKELESNSAKNNIEWKSFKIGELFEIKPTKAYKMTNTTLFETKGDVPVVTNSSLNNGVSAYVGLDPTEKGNMITYSDTTTSEGIFYQPRDFVGYSHIQGLYPLVHKDKWNRYSLLYFVSVFRKASFGKFDYGNKFNRKIAKEMRVLLPILPTPSLRGVGEAHNEAKQGSAEVSLVIHKTQQESKMDCHEVANATSRDDETTKSNAEAVEMRKQGKAEVSLVNCGFQGGGEGSYLKGNDRVDNADAVAKQQIHTCKSAIYRSNTTQGYEIDFNFMESFIKAIEKQHIETLYRFWESKLKAYNAVINGGGGG